MASGKKDSKASKLTAIPGVGAATAKKLVNAKLDTVSKVATAGAAKLVKAGLQAAVAKKGRFNILRIYRRNNNKEQCKLITKDMRYIDKKYGLNKTKDIC